MLLMALNTFNCSIFELCNNVVSFIPTSDGNLDSEYFHQSEESSQFRSEYEMRKMKQVCQFHSLSKKGMSLYRHFISQYLLTVKEIEL